MLIAAKVLPLVTYFYCFYTYTNNRRPIVSHISFIERRHFTDFERPLT